jgi:hemin uptake protein HemP
MRRRMDMDRNGRSTAPATGHDTADGPLTRSLDSRDLLAGGREVMIRHGESTYRLRSTNKGKLILTK